MKRAMIFSANNTIRYRFTNQIYESMVTFAVTLVDVLPVSIIEPAPVGNKKISGVNTPLCLNVVLCLFESSEEVGKPILFNNQFVIGGFQYFKLPAVFTIAVQCLVGEALYIP